jgi:hypothetical protein
MKTRRGSKKFRKIPPKVRLHSGFIPPECREAFEKFKVKCDVMTLGQAGAVKRARVWENMSYQAVAQYCYDNRAFKGWERWSPPNDPAVGMALVWRAAQILEEDWTLPPW